MAAHGEFDSPERRSPPRRCERCRRPITSVANAGRPRRYCSQACRQRAYEARQVQRLGDSAEAEIRRRRAEVADLGDRLAELVELAAELVDHLDGYVLEDEDPAIRATLERLRPLLGPEDPLRRNAGNSRYVK